jgi:hypothetical protein
MYPQNVQTVNIRIPEPFEYQSFLVPVFKWYKAFTGLCIKGYIKFYLLYKMVQPGTIQKTGQEIDWLQQN